MHQVYKCRKGVISGPSRRGLKRPPMMRNQTFGEPVANDRVWPIPAIRLARAPMTGTDPKGSIRRLDVNLRYGDRKADVPDGGPQRPIPAKLICGGSQLTFALTPVGGPTSMRESGAGLGPAGPAGPSKTT